MVNPRVFTRFYLVTNYTYVTTSHVGMKGKEIKIYDKYGKYA